MNAGVTIKIDTREFNRALNELWKHSSRGYATFVNSEAFNLASTALRLTKAVKPSQISRDPALRPPRVWKTLNAWRRRKGLDPLGGTAMGAWAKDHIDARKQSVNYVRSGWLAPMAVLWKYMKGPEGPKFRRNRSIRRAGGNRQGWAHPAGSNTSGISLCEIGSFSTNNPGKFSGRAGNPGAIAFQGLYKAVQSRIRYFKRRLEEKLAQDVAKFASKAIFGR